MRVTRVGPVSDWRGAPEHTLGWDVLGWMMRYLRSPVGDGSPYRPTREQARFILHWYAYDPGTGAYAYPGGVLQRLKGWGKDPLGAALALAELCGPVWPARTPEGGWCGVRRPGALVQLVGVSRAQTRNTTRFLPKMATPWLEDEHDVRFGAEITRAFGGSAQLVASSSGYATLEGMQVTFALANETHHWKRGNAGHELFDTVADNAAKVGGRVLQITNAHVPGEGSVLEYVRRTHDRMGDQSAMLVDSLEVDVDNLTREEFTAAYEVARGDSHWCNPDRAWERVSQLAVLHPARARRMYLNCVVASDDMLYQAGEVESVTIRQWQPPAGSVVTLGFDGSTSRDSTALVAYDRKARAFSLLGLWEAPPGARADQWEVPRGKVDAAVRAAFRKYKVAGFACDVARWEQEIARWERDLPVTPLRASGDSRFGWDMRVKRKLTVRANEALVEAVRDGRVRLAGGDKMTDHVLSARRRETADGLGFVQHRRDSAEGKVDVYAAMVLAYAMAVKGERPGKRGGTATGGVALG